MEERSNERDWWTADREKAQRWIFQFSPEHANLYRGAVQILYGAELPGKLQFVAHAVREIRNGLPRAIEPSDHERFDSKEGIERVGKMLAREGGRFREGTLVTISVEADNAMRSLVEENRQVRDSNLNSVRRMFMRDVGAEGGELLWPLAKQWFDVGEWFMSQTHVPSTKRVANSDSDEHSEEMLREKFVQFEQPLISLATDFYAPLTKLDEAMSDVEMTVEKVLPLLVHQEQVRYFFRKVDRPEWVKQLSIQFCEPPEVIDDEDGVTRYPEWPLLAFLKRVADRRCDDFVDVMLSLTVCDNPRVHRDLIEIALRLPATDSVAIVKRFLWTTIKGRKEIHYDLQHALLPLLLHLARGAQTEAARELFVSIAKTLPTVSDVGLVLDLPRTKLDVWNYEQFIVGSLHLVNLDGENYFRQLVMCLRGSIYDSRLGAKPEPPGDGSMYWRPDVVDTEVERDDPRNVLADSVYRAVLQLAVTSDVAARVFEILRNEPFAIFTRIGLRGLSERVSIAPKEVSKWLLERDRFESIDVAQEYSYLLRAGFQFLERAEQKTLMSWIEAGPRDLSRERWDGSSFSDIELLALRERWQLERLRPLSEQLDVEWSVYYARLCEGEDTDASIDASRGVWVGPTSPFSSEELAGLNCDDLVKKLGDWVPPSGHMVDTPSGLGRKLATVVGEAPMRYEATDKLTVLEPTYVRAFIDGFDKAVSAGRQVPWGGVLTLGEFILSHPFDPAGGEALRRDIGWRWSRMSLARLVLSGLAAKVIPLALRSRVWSVLDKLSEDPDPSPETEERSLVGARDPVELSLNATRSIVVQAAITYGEWVQPEEPTAMPKELRAALERRLDSSEPSRAVRSVFGRYFSLLYQLDPTWTERNARRIFVFDGGTMTAAWGAYLARPRTHKIEFSVVSSCYHDALSSLDAVGSLRETDLGERLVDFFLLGAFELSVGGLLDQFWSATRSETRQEILEYLGVRLMKTVDPLLLERAQQLWGWVEAKHAPAKENVGELQSFGWWFLSEFPLDWAIATLLRVVKTTKKIGFAEGVVAKLGRIVPVYPKEALEILNQIIWGQHLLWRVRQWKGTLEQALRINLIDEQNGIFAREMIERFARKGIHDFRGLA